MDAMRAMLDELMGKERNAPLNERSQKAVRWDDPAVCKYQLCGVCPSKLFKNTKSDLGPCEYEVHDDHLDWPTIKADYERADPRDQERYERKLMKYLDDLIREMDRKIAKNKERAEKESAPRELLPVDRDRLADLKARAKDAVEKAEALAEQGEVDQAHLLQQQAEAYNKQHDELLARLTTPEKTMIVCEICGVFINSTDNEQRRRAGLGPSLIMDHLEGKQYLGWKAIRERFAELVAKYGPVTAGPPGGPPGRSLPPPPDRSRSAPRTSDREHDREREGDRRDREYGRDRDRDYRRDDRDYGREREYRDRDRDSRRDDRDYRREYGRDSRDSSRRYDSGSGGRPDRDYRDAARETDRRRY